MTDDVAGGDGPIINITGDLVALGPLRRDLLPLYEHWINNFGTLRTLGGYPPGPMASEKEVRWFEQAATRDNEATFTIYERVGLRPIGTTALHAIDYRNRSAIFGIMIGEADARGQGYGTETTKLMLDFAFTALGLNNVMLTVYEFNWAGQRAYTKAGFKEFGRRRQARWMGGRFWDEIYMDCLASEFTSPVLAKVFQPDAQREA